MHLFAFLTHDQIGLQICKIYVTNVHVHAFDIRVLVTNGSTVVCCVINKQDVSTCGSWLILWMFLTYKSRQTINEKLQVL